jgi:hypothetical protein
LPCFGSRAFTVSTCAPRQVSSELFKSSKGGGDSQA